MLLITCLLAVFCSSQPITIPGPPSLITEDTTSPPLIIRKDCGTCIDVGDDAPPGGCSDVQTMECVCVDAEEQSCCTTKWTSDCVNTAMEMCDCVVPTPTPIPTYAGSDCGDCTAIHSGGPPGGCSDSVTMECVCLEYLGGLFFGCCSFNWDDICVLLAESVCHCEPFVVQPVFTYSSFIDLGGRTGDIFSLMMPQRLLYRGSVHGFGGSIFHKRCHNQGPTLTFVTTTEGYKFGAYASVSWMSVGNYVFAPGCFLFTFGQGDTLIAKMYPKFGKTNNMYDIGSRGPTFGGGHDIYIADNSNTKTDNYANPSTYERFDGGSYTNETLAGARNFQVEEIEVFGYL